MNKVQFFSDSDILALQESINDWLSRNEGIRIIESNINSIVKPDLLGNMQNIEKHVFYILYSTVKKRGGRAMMAEAISVPEAGNIAQASPVHVEEQKPSISNRKS